MTGPVYIDNAERSQAEIILNGRKAASGFKALGIGESSTVTLLLRNDFCFLVATLGARQLGAYCVPLNWHSKSAELAFVLSDSAPDVIVGHAGLLLEIRDILPHDVPIIVVETIEADKPSVSEFDCAIEWTSWLRSQEPLEAMSAVARGTVVYTSGTTGNPKAVLREPLSRIQFGRWAANQQMIFGIVPSTRTAIIGPMYHASPNSNGIFAVQISELIKFYTKFDAEQLLRDVERYRLTTIVTVPTTFVRLLKLPEEVSLRYRWLPMGCFLALRVAKRACSGQVWSFGSRKPAISRLSAPGISRP